LLECTGSLKILNFNERICMNIAKRILLSSVFFINISQQSLRAELADAASSFIAAGSSFVTSMVQNIPDMVKEEAGKHLSSFPRKVFDAVKSGVHKGLYESFSSYKNDAVGMAILEAKGMDGKKIWTSDEDKAIAAAANKARSSEYPATKTTSAFAQRSAISAIMLMDDYLLTSSDCSVLDKVGMSACKLAETEIGHHEGWMKDIKIKNGQIVPAPNEGPLLKLHSSITKTGKAVWNPREPKHVLFGLKSLLWLTRVGLSVGDVKARKALKSGDLELTRFATRFVMAAAADYTQDAVGTCFIKSIVDWKLPKMIFSSEETA